MIRQNGILSLAEVEVYEDPISCDPIGSPCDDGDLNTINDVEDGDCNCAGTIITCDDLLIESQINSDLRVRGEAVITVSEGSDVGLYLNFPGIDYTVTGPGNVSSSPLINDITIAQSGQYSVFATLEPVIFYVDSEELSIEDGRVVNAIDGDPGTIWHTDWSDVNKPYPHDIIIDLRANSNITGLEYLPRPDGVWWPYLRVLVVNGHLQRRLDQYER